MRKQVMTQICLWCLCISAGRLVAQELPPNPTATPAHAWLKQFVGQWTTESRGIMGPDQPQLECSGTLSSKMLGEFWVLNEMKGDMAGTAMVGLQTIGYDADKKQYIGTWVDSMMDHMWRYTGNVDRSGKILTLEADGPDFSGSGKLTKYQDIYEFKTADEIVMTSRMLGADGKWVTFMSGTATRVKP